jgi:hypothetical protein
MTGMIMGITVAGSWVAEAAPGAGYRPFWNPLPLWDYWYLLLIPLCLGISIVYKSVKCHTMRQVPREAAEIFATIMIGFIAAAAALMGLLWLVQRG